MDIKIQVAERLIGSSKSVKDKVLEVLTNKELERRTEACLKIIEKIEELDKQYKKESKPDIETYNEDGTVDKTSFSKEKVDSLRKLREQRVRFDDALKKALEQNDFSKALELTK